MGSIRVGINSAAGVAASGTVTAAGVLAGDTVTVAGQVFTAVNGGSPTNVQFDMSGSNTQTGANIAAALTNHPTVGKYVKATNASGVVTITAVTDGYIGNLITLASSNGTRLAVSGTNLTGGAGNNTQTTTLYKFGV
jgi:phage tail sheath gpL-like